MNYRLSVIIPTYNRAYCIENCLEAILRCTEQQMEVIVVNDGSTDDTETIVQEVMKADKRVSLISQENKGVSAARNAGLHKAQGEYLMFSDSDDWIEGENIAKLLDYADNQKADITVFGRINHYTDGKIRELLHTQRTISVCDDIGAAAGKTILKNTEYGWSCCNKLYRREIVVSQNLCFIDYSTVNSEDRLFNLGYFASAKTISFFDDCSFHNIVHDDSLSKAHYFERLVERNVNSFMWVCRYLQNLPTAIRAQLLRYYYISFLNNVAVLSAGRNHESMMKAIRQVKETVAGMEGILRAQSLSLGKRNVQLLPSLGRKNRLLDCLMITMRWHSVAAAMLYIYVKFMRVV